MYCLTDGSIPSPHHCRLLKALITESPTHIVWVRWWANLLVRNLCLALQLHVYHMYVCHHVAQVFTGSSMAMLWAGVAAAPVNGVQMAIECLLRNHQ